MLICCVKQNDKRMKNSIQEVKIYYTSLDNPALKVPIQKFKESTTNPLTKESIINFFRNTLFLQFDSQTIKWYYKKKGIPFVILSENNPPDWIRIDKKGICFFLSFEMNNNHNQSSIISGHGQGLMSSLSLNKDFSLEDKTKQNPNSQLRGFSKKGNTEDDWKSVKSDNFQIQIFSKKHSETVLDDDNGLDGQNGIDFTKYHSHSSNFSNQSTQILDQPKNGPISNSPKPNQNARQSPNRKLSPRNPSIHHFHPKKSTETEKSLSKKPNTNQTQSSHFLMIPSGAKKQSSDVKFPVQETLDIFSKKNNSHTVVQTTPQTEGEQILSDGFSNQFLVGLSNINSGKQNNIDSTKKDCFSYFENSMCSSNQPDLNLKSISRKPNSNLLNNSTPQMGSMNTFQNGEQFTPHSIPLDRYHTSPMLGNQNNSDSKSLSHKKDDINDNDSQINTPLNQKNNVEKTTQLKYKQDLHGPLVFVLFSDPLVQVMTNSDEDSESDSDSDKESDNDKDNDKNNLRDNNNRNNLLENDNRNDSKDYNENDKNVDKDNDKDKNTNNENNKHNNISNDNYKNNDNDDDNHKNDVKISKSRNFKNELDNIEKVFSRIKTFSGKVYYNFLTEESLRNGLNNRPNILHLICNSKFKSVERINKIDPLKVENSFINIHRVISGTESIQETKTPGFQQVNNFDKFLSNQESEQNTINKTVEGHNMSDNLIINKQPSNPNYQRAFNPIPNKQDFNNNAVFDRNLMNDNAGIFKNKNDNNQTQRDDNKMMTKVFHLVFEDKKGREYYVNDQHLKNYFEIYKLHNCILLILSVDKSEELIDMFKNLDSGGLEYIICIKKHQKINKKLLALFFKYFYDFVFRNEPIRESFEKSKKMIRLEVSHKPNDLTTFCNHKHKKDCSLKNSGIDQIDPDNKTNYYDISEYKCSCEFNQFNIHSINCDKAPDFLVNFHRYPYLLNESNEKLQRLCCCCQELDHDEINKIELFIKNPQKGDLRLSDARKSKYFNEINYQFHYRSLYVKFPEVDAKGFNERIYEIVNFFKTKNSSKIAVILGESGTGKSTLAKSVANYSKIRNFINICKYRDLKDKSESKHEIHSIVDTEKDFYENKKKESNKKKNLFQRFETKPTLLIFDNCDYFISHNPTLLSNLNESIKSYPIWIIITVLTETNLYQSRDYIIFDVPILKREDKLHFFYKMKKTNLELAFTFSIFVRMINEMLEKDDKNYAFLLDNVPIVLMQSLAICESRQNNVKKSLGTNETNFFYNLEELYKEYNQNNSKHIVAYEILTLFNKLVKDFPFLGFLGFFSQGLLFVEDFIEICILKAEILILKNLLKFMNSNNFFLNLFPLEDKESNPLKSPPSSNFNALEALNNENSSKKSEKMDWELFEKFIKGDLTNQNDYLRIDLWNKLNELFIKRTVIDISSTKSINSQKEKPNKKIHELINLYPSQTNPGRKNKNLVIKHEYVLSYLIKTHHNSRISLQMIHKYIEFINMKMNYLKQSILKQENNTTDPIDIYFIISSFDPFDSKAIDQSKFSRIESMITCPEYFSMHLENLKSILDEPVFTFSKLALHENLNENYYNENKLFFENLKKLMWNFMVLSKRVFPEKKSKEIQKELIKSILKFLNSNIDDPHNTNEFLVQTNIYSLHLNTIEFEATKRNDLKLRIINSVKELSDEKSNPQKEQIKESLGSSNIDALNKDKERIYFESMLIRSHAYIKLVQAFDQKNIQTECEDKVVKLGDETNQIEDDSKLSVELKSLIGLIVGTYYKNAIDKLEKTKTDFVYFEDKITGFENRLLKSLEDLSFYKNELKTNGLNPKLYKLIEAFIEENTDDSDQVV